MPGRHQTTISNHNLNQWWPSLLMHTSATRPQWVNSKMIINTLCGTLRYLLTIYVVNCSEETFIYIYICCHCSALKWHKYMKLTLTIDKKMLNILYSVSRLLIIWWHNKPGNQYVWYWHCLPDILDIIMPWCHLEPGHQQAWDQSRFIGIYRVLHHNMVNIVYVPFQ